MRHHVTALFLLVFLAAPACARDSITLGTADTQENAAAKTANLLLSECFHRLNYRLNILLRPSKRSIVEADDGHVDGDFARTKAVALIYPNLIKVPEYIGLESLTAFATDPNLQVSGWDSIAARHVTWVSGREICNLYLGHIPRKTLEQNEVALLRFLSAERAEVGVLGRHRGCELLKRLGITNVHPIEPPLEEAKLYLYLHKKHEALVPEVTAMLRRLKSDGTYEAIRQHYFENAPYPEGLLSSARP